MSEKLDPAKLMFITSNSLTGKNGSIYNITSEAVLKNKEIKENDKKKAADIIKQIPEICRKASENGEWCARICAAEGVFYSTNKTHPICGTIYHGYPCGYTEIVYDYCVAIFGKLRTFMSNKGSELFLTVTWAEITDEQLKELDKTNDISNI